MRTTLTLEPDVAEALRQRQRQTARSYKDVVNEALRRGLAIGDIAADELEPFTITPFHCGLQPGVDWQRLNQLADDLEADRFAAENLAPYKAKR